MKYTIVIPAYNEEARLAGTIDDYAAFVETNLGAENAEVLIVVNGSRDRTGDIARELEAKYPCVRAWETKSKLGKGGAVLKGFELAKGAILAFADADNATPPHELNKLLQEIERGTDAALGSRWLPESKQVIPQPFSRRVAGRIFNLIVRLLFQMPFKDTQCGAKAFKREPLETIRERLTSTGWAFDVDLIWQFSKSQYSVNEVAINWSDASKSRLRMHTDGPAMLWELIKLRFRG
ncbi:glycosyltransferase [bacterium]|nr:glycosyltransferase [bacterium]